MRAYTSAAASGLDAASATATSGGSAYQHTADANDDAAAAGRPLTRHHDDDDDDECEWEVVKVIDIPHSAYFTDYSGIAFYGTGSVQQVGVISQEDAALWVSTFDFDRLEFDDDSSAVYHFPRNDNCDIRCGGARARALAGRSCTSPVAFVARKWQADEWAPAGENDGRAVRLAASYPASQN